MAGHRKLGSRWCASLVVVAAAGVTGCLASMTAATARRLGARWPRRWPARASPRPGVETVGRGRSMGLFADGTRPFGLDHGVVLSTGRADAVLPSSTASPGAPTTTVQVMPTPIPSCCGERRRHRRSTPRPSSSTLCLRGLGALLLRRGVRRRPGRHQRHRPRPGERCGVRRRRPGHLPDAATCSAGSATRLDCPQRVAAVETCRERVIAGEVNHFKVTVADEGDDPSTPWCCSAPDHSQSSRRRRSPTTSIQSST